MFALKNCPDARRRGASSGAYSFRYVSSTAMKATQQMGIFSVNYIVLPTASATFLSSFINTANLSGFNDCAPSQRAFSGSA